MRKRFVNTLATRIANEPASRRSVIKQPLLLSSCFVVACAIVLLPLENELAVAQKLGGKSTNSIDFVKLFGIGPGTGAEGLVIVQNNVDGPDALELRIQGLPPGERIAVMLTRHAEPGKLPAQFIGEFRTNKRGIGRLSLRAEIVDAFASANQNLEDKLGEADDATAGRLPFPLGGSANTIPLDWFRGYFVDIAPHNVFGPNADTPGGAPAFLSAAPLK